ncbi:8389_t:CDS:2 [Diversispora eburnea]|uniref:8389_t:CDS:1 n=1 Tax=Diversispora eburnea TaxID=1213867 RepID=A0A9N9FXF1_9GLOM|nr:8389_t:CDS:2 [Diversispora eburnea]
MNTYKDRDLMVDGSMVYCRPHRSESCSECNLDLSPLNSLYKALSQVHGDIPPPNALNPNIARQISSLRENGNKNLKEQNFDEAIKYYTYAIEFSFQRPIWEPHELTAQEVAYCLGRRSLAYISIKSLVNAYVDAEWGIRIKPDSVECLEFVPNDGNFKNVLEEALEKALKLAKNN